MTHAHTLVSGWFRSADLHETAARLAQWAGVNGPGPLADEYEIDHEDVSLYLHRAHDFAVPSLLMECMLPPDLGHSRQRLELLIDVCRRASIDGTLDMVLVDGDGNQISSEETYEIAAAPGV